MQIPETRRKPYKYAAFIDKLKRQAEKATDPDDAWLPWPGQKKLTPRTRNEYANRLNNGDQWGPGFEGVVRNGYLYARYVG